MRIADKNFVFELTMKVYDVKKAEFSCDLSNDILQLGNFSSELNAYVVDDLPYVLSYVNDWKNYKGDFFYDDQQPHLARLTFCNLVESL